MPIIYNTFETWLTFACILTGLIWLFDRIFLARRREKHAKRNWVSEFARSFFPVLLIVLLLRTFVFEPFRIPSKSMVPTLLVGDFILVEKYAYGLRLPVTHTKILGLGKPQRGDIAVFRYPRNPAENYIKRVIGLPGDHIVYKNNRLHVNGELVPHTKLGLYEGPDASILRPMKLFSEDLPGDNDSHPILKIKGIHGPCYSAEYVKRYCSVTVPEGMYFVMGDNRDNSADSRVWGFVPKENLVGQAFLIWFSIDWSDFDVRWSRIGNILS